MRDKPTTSSWRTMTPSGETKDCASPTDAQPPRGYKWAGKWKIEVSKETDSYGWVSGSGGGMKRRRWLRMVKKSSTLRLDGPATMLSEEVVSSVVQQDAPANATIAKTAEASAKSTKVLTKLISQKIQNVKDDWNWKGFGWSFYKSFLYPEAGGVSFRMPISQNFLTYFSRPWLPSINSSIGFYYPWSIGLFLSFSIPIQLYFLFFVRFAQSFLRFLKIRKTPVDRVEYSINVVQRMGVR